MSGNPNSPAVKPFSIKTSTGTLPSDLTPHIVRYVSSQKAKFQDERQVVEAMWQEAWALYIGTSEAMDSMRSQIVKTVGDVNVDWRHKINVGKAFEAVETIHGYLMAATFPNRDWFDVVPQLPSSLQLAKLVQKYVQAKLEDGKFRANYENFLRQLIITGNSVMALPWRYETLSYKKKVKISKQDRGSAFGVIDLDESQDYQWETVEEERVIQNSPDFETLDMFDCFFDTANKDANQSTFIRRLYKSKAEVITCIHDGTYEKVPITVIQQTKPYGSTKASQVQRYSGINTQNWSPSEIVEVWEYWGDVHLDDVTYKDVVITILGDDTLLRFEQNPYWGGRPFIYGSYIPVMQTYAMGAIQPSAGLLHELNIVSNHRLDNLELSIDQMWTVRADGLLQPNEVYTEPGKVFLVADHTDIQPIAGNTADYPITYQESGVLESFIDKNFGTGPLVGSGQPRGGERVTAEEIQAVRDAGGNRLSNLHKHIEDTSLMPLLSKVIRLFQQFVDADETIRVAGAGQDVFEYYSVGPDELNGEWKLKPIGADFVADRNKYIKQRLDFLSAVTQIPQMAPLLNYQAILRDLVTHFGFDDPDSYINSDGGQPAMPEEMPVEDPAMEGEAQLPGLPGGGTELADQVFQMGGAPLQQALMNDMNAGGMEQVMAKYAGQELPPELQS